MGVRLVHLDLTLANTNDEFDLRNNVPPNILAFFMLEQKKQHEQRYGVVC